VKERLKRYYSPLFLAPATIVYGGFFLVPVVISFYFAFTNWNVFLTEIDFTGFSNFRNIFENPVMSLALRNTLLFALLTTVGKNVIGLGLALAVESKARFRNLFRSIFFSPAVLSYIVIGLLFTAILSPRGIVNDALSALGLHSLARSWVADKGLVMYSLSLVEIWQWSGFHMAIYLAGLQSVPKELKDAAAIDGAFGATRFWRITLPLIIPSLNVSLVTALISGFKVFDLVFIMTNGGPGYASEVVSTQIYTMMGLGRWGEATAMNLLLFMIVSLIALAILSILRKREVEL
jgi:raffinose/stachyose/melibiose transport system permease protein